ncbi:muscle M-line assembly protein unc-89-like isoform X15 [Hypomesus transpacificus]|uniref:muscle M-line assembly protein unc-89-like isoform X15 n=1 Tax=Hypomesus transpacificus TaxID=137520 RepID=UPI001F08521A|nr:muscle M-line assembly protein unc-89-like isoform X15 [Hypomesus transpacificus]
MAIRSVILCIGVYFVFVKAADAEHGKLGGKITLVPTVKGQMDEILWKHKGNKVVEFDGSQNKEFGSYVGRTVLDFVTGELIISALTTEDSGHYELEAHINNLLKYSQHQVEVIAEVAQPTIICVLNDTKTTASMATLQCNADPQDQQSPMTYSWEGLEGTLLSSSSIDQKLSIVVKDRHDKAVFQCSVSNLVSKKQAQFQVKNCFTDESSSTVLAVCLSLLCLVILLILAVLALWFYKRHKKAEPALNKQDNVENPSEQKQVKEERKLFDRLAKQQIPTKERLDDQNGNKKQENIERTEGNSTLPSTQALPQQAQNEEKRSGPPSPSQASMIQSDQNILQPGQETVPDQDPAEPVEVSLPDQKSVVASITKEPTDPAIPDPEPEGPTCPTKQDTGAEETGNQKQPDADILGKTGLLTNPNNPTQAGSEPEAPKNQFDTNTEATSEVPAKGHQVENSESCSTSPGGEEGDKDGLKKAEKEIEPRNGETNDETNDDRIDKDAMDQNGEEAIKKTEQKKEHSSQFSTLSPKDDQINGSTLDAVAVSKPTEPSQDQPELDDSKAVRDVDLCQQKPNSQSGSISPGGVVGSEKGSKEAEEEMEAGDVEKEIPEGGGDHSIRIDGNMKTDDEENKKSFVAVGDTVAVSKPTEPSQDQPEPDDSKAVRDVDLCQQKPNSQSGSISPGGVVGSEKGSKEAEEEMEAGDVEKEIPEGGGDHSIRIDGNMKTDDEENKKSFVEVGDTVAVSKPTEPSQDQPEPDDSKAVRDVDLCQQKPNSQSGSISPGGVVGSEKGSEEAEEEMEAGDVEKEIPEGGGDHSIRIDGNMKTDDKENKKSFVEVGDTEHQSMKEEKTGTDERAEQHPDPGEKADVSSQSETVTAGVKNNADKEQDDKKDKGGIKVDSPMEGAGSDEQGDSNEEKAKGTEQGETDQKLED